MPNKPNTHGIDIAGWGDIGDPNNCKIPGVMLLTNGTSIHFAAGGNVNNVRILSAWDVFWAAQANGKVGISVEAVNDIDIKTNSEFGLCPDGNGLSGPQVLTPALVR